eukprot:1556284-Rhodomonas_salina.2
MWMTPGCCPRLIRTKASAEFPAGIQRLGPKRVGPSRVTSDAAMRWIRIALPASAPFVNFAGAKSDTRVHSPGNQHTQPHLTPQTCNVALELGCPSAGFPPFFTLSLPPQVAS